MGRGIFGEWRFRDEDEEREKITQRRRERRDSQRKRNPRRETQDPGRKPNLGHPPFINGEFSTGVTDLCLR